MRSCERCKHRGALNHICDECIDGEMYEKVVITNADRIRSMTDEELAELLTGSCNSIGIIHCPQDDEFFDETIIGSSCINCMREWLKSEVGCE